MHDADAAADLAHQNVYSLIVGVQRIRRQLQPDHLPDAAGLRTGWGGASKAEAATLLPGSTTHRAATKSENAAEISQRKARSGAQTRSETQPTNLPLRRRRVPRPLRIRRIQGVSTVADAARAASMSKQILCSDSVLIAVVPCAPIAVTAAQSPASGSVRRVRQAGRPRRGARGRVTSGSSPWKDLH
jgi:hypothetical protein